MTITQKQLERLCQEWQQRLRLRDWDIRVRFESQQVINADARNTYGAGVKAASIEICRPDEHTQLFGQPYDAEQFLVHELLHLHFTGLDKFESGTPQYTTLESAIDLIAWGLVRAKRGEI